MEKGILEDNALEAWAKAIEDCIDIRKGKVTLGYRKNFVGHLHNAVELFVKQRMLNAGDHRVASVKNLNNPEGRPLREYYARDDLNDYFKDLDSETRGKFYSAEFNMLQKYSKDLFADFFQKNSGSQERYSRALSTLAHLRNCETHFYIDKESFLSDDEFRQLHDFMIIFYKILVWYELLPKTVTEIQYAAYIFDRKLPENFSYKNAVLSSEYMRNLALSIDSTKFPWIGESPYEIAQSICILFRKYRSREEFISLVTYIDGAVSNKLMSWDIVPEKENPTYDGLVGWKVFSKYHITFCTLSGEMMTR